MKSFRSESGVAVLEFAFILTLIGIITGASLAYGLVFFEELAIVEALRIGSRSAATCAIGTPPNVVTQRIRQSMDAFLAASRVNQNSYQIKITPTTYPVPEGPAENGVIITLRHSGNVQQVFGQLGISTLCFSGSALLEKTNTADASADDGTDDC